MSSSYVRRTDPWLSFWLHTRGIYECSHVYVPSDTSISNSAERAISWQATLIKKGKRYVQALRSRRHSTLPEQRILVACPFNELGFINCEVRKHSPQVVQIDDYQSETAVHARHPATYPPRLTIHGMKTKILMLMERVRGLPRGGEIAGVAGK
jgi:hypothetical protein